MTRDRGTGSVYQDSRGRWRATIEAGWTASGTRRRIVITAATKREAQTKLKTRLRKIAESGIPAPGTTSVTVKRWASDWLERRTAELRPATIRAHRTAVTRWIVPTIGHRRLSALTPADVRAVDTTVTAGASSTSAHRVHAVLVRMLRDAITDGHAVPPRCLMVKPPAVAVHDRTAPAVDQCVALLTTAAGDPDLSRWAAALLQGMRQGECLGLTWDAVDLDGRTVDVSWQLQEVPWRHGCTTPCDRRAEHCPDRTYRVPNGYEVRALRGQQCLVRPKTTKGRRVIPLVPWMVQTLTDWRRVAPPSPHGLVWPAPDGQPRDAEDDRDQWRELQHRAEVAHPSGRPYHVHEARHATATLLMEAGVPESVRIAILGHSTAAVTRIYEHANGPMVLAALEAVATRLGLVG